MEFTGSLRAMRDLGLYSPDEWQEYLSYFELSEDENRDVGDREASGEAAELRARTTSRMRPTAPLPSRDLARKIKDPRALEAIGKGAMLGLVSGGYDLVHLGHLRSFAAARSALDEGSDAILVAAVLRDHDVQAKKGASRPIMSMAERVEVLVRVRALDYVTVLAQPNCLELLREVKPAYFLKQAADFAQPIVRKEAELVGALGGKTLLLPPHEGRSFSTSELVRVLGPVEGSDETRRR